MMQSFEKRDTRTNEDNTHNDLAYPKSETKDLPKLSEEFFDVSSETSIFYIFLRATVSSVTLLGK